MSTAQTSPGSDFRRSSVTSEMSILKLADQSTQRKLLLPVDPSKHSERALDWFLDNVYRQGDIVELAFVVEPPEYDIQQAAGQSGSSFVQEGNRAYNEGMKEAAKLKAKFIAKLKEAKVPDCDINFQELIGSKPGETLAKYIKETDISCVVIGSRGLGKIKRTFLGSVSDTLLHSVKCPIIICPNRKDKEK